MSLHLEPGMSVEQIQDKLSGLSASYDIHRWLEGDYLILCSNDTLHLSFRFSEDIQMVIGAEMKDLWDYYVFMRTVLFEPLSPLVEVFDFSDGTEAVQHFYDSIRLSGSALSVFILQYGILDAQDIKDTIPEGTYLRHLREWGVSEKTVSKFCKGCNSCDALEIAATLDEIKQQATYHYLGKPIYHHLMDDD